LVKQRDSVIFPLLTFRIEIQTFRIDCGFISFGDYPKRLGVIGWTDRHGIARYAHAKRLKISLPFDILGLKLDESWLHVVKSNVGCNPALC
jgi:hypothetical protein